MKNKVIKFIISLIIFIFIIVGFRCIYIYYTVPIAFKEGNDKKPNVRVNLNFKLSTSEVEEDRNQIIDIMESTHPIFLEKVPKRYYEAKDNFIKNTNKEMLAKELQLEVSKYLSSIDDGHTMVDFGEDSFLNVKWKYVDNKLLLLDDNNNITTKEVISINDKSVNEIIRFIDEVFPNENHVAEDINNATYMKFKSVLLNSGVDCSDDVVLEIKDIDKKDKKEKIEIDFIKEFVNDYEGAKTRIEKLDNETVYIQLGECEINKTLEYIIGKLNNEIDEGKINKVIVDVRNNPGGDSKACIAILDSLGIQPARYGQTVRFSSLAKEGRGYLRSNGKTTNKPDNSTAIKNEDIDLYIVTNENTFSSAQMLAIWVKDGDLGKVVGQPSSNKPSCYGDILYYSLDNSKITGQISHKKWNRPDASKDQEDVLEMDIPVEYGVDPIEVIMNGVN